jgi:nucleotide-binding universal stress UspA family protein
MSALSRPLFPEPRTAAGLRHVLFPSDLSPQSERAFSHARLLAERFGARLTLFHALPRTGLEHLPSPSPDEREALRRAEAFARAWLERRAEGLPVRADVIVQPAASAPEALVDYICATAPDLAVMATHGRDGLAHLMLGSVTEKALRYAPCPILCVREPDHGTALPYRRILLPTSLDEESRRAFPAAALLARHFGAEVLLLHVAPAPPSPSLSGVPDLVEGLPTEQDVLAFAVADFRGVRLVPRVEMGPVWERIGEVAAQEKPDVLVISTHGHDSLADRLIGTHAEGFVRHAPCPVLVVR